MMGRRGFLRTIGAAVLGMSLALRIPEETGATTRRKDPDGSYWVIFPDGREVMVLGPRGTPVDPDLVVKTMVEAHTHDMANAGIPAGRQWIAR